PFQAEAEGRLLRLPDARSRSQGGAPPARHVRSRTVQASPDPTPVALLEPRSRRLEPRPQPPPGAGLCRLPKAPDFIGDLVDLARGTAVALRGAVTDRW